MSAPLQIGLVLFPRVTQLDFTGPLQVFSSIPDAQVHLVWKRIEPVPTDSVMMLTPTISFADCPQLDVVCVPGGFGIDAMVNDTNAKIVSDRGFKLATAPKITLPEDKDAVDALISGKTDLSYTVALEVMPQIKLADFKGVTLEKPVADIADSEIEEAVANIVKQNTPFAAKADGAKAAQGDRAVVSFVGRVDGKEFDGGKADDVSIQIGSGQFIPGFEDQVVGLGAGDNGTIKVTFPEGYANKELAGKPAEFDVRVKSLERSG